MRNHLSKKLGLSVAAFAMVAASMLTGEDAKAMPGFARQTGMPCSACHFQTFPALNSMGRGFKAGGYVMEGAQASIEGENALKLPVDINIGGVIKIRTEKTDGDYKKTGLATDFGEIQFPDEAGFLVGGRLSANAGFLWEISLVQGGTGLVGAKYVFNAAKVGGVQLQVIPYSSSTPAYGGELANTGSLALQRIAEDKTYMAPFQLGFDSHDGTGINLAAQTPNWSVNYNMFAPVGTLAGATAMNITGLGTYIRAQYFMDLAGFDTAIGVAQMSGSAKTMVPAVAAVAKTGTTAAVVAAPAYEKKLATEGSWFDIQLQGQVAGMDTGFFFSTGSTPKAGTAAKTDYVYNGVAEAKKATGFATKVALTPELMLTLQSGTVSVGDKSSTAKSSLGVQYMIAQNIKFEITSVSDSTGAYTTATGTAMKSKTVKLQQLMLFIGM